MRPASVARVRVWAREWTSGLADVEVGERTRSPQTDHTADVVLDQRVEVGGYFEDEFCRQVGERRGGRWHGDFCVAR